MDEWEVIDAPPTEEFQSYQQEGGGAKDQVVSQPPDQEQEPTGTLILCSRPLLF